MTIMRQTAIKGRPETSVGQEGLLQHLEEIIHEAAHLLPAQGAIRVFIHHNPLHAFEELPFDLAVQKGARIFGCHPYLPEHRYRAKLAKGKIRVADLERRYRMQALDALAIHARRIRLLSTASSCFTKSDLNTETPSAQIICCLDDREESFRRHLEELCPSLETYGAAGFFNVAMDYRGVADAHFVQLCPVTIRPARWVVETVAAEMDELDRDRARLRRMLGSVLHGLHAVSRTFLGGAVLALFGAVASIPLVSRVLFPRTSGYLWRWAGKFVQAPAVTRLRLD
ncbi:MAG TPA: putative inorganic carbon transporter subunit DabA, partial [Gemmataceae bacterium]|nr:putative inorganic carbon transporter subunit DabA [Gemmataceae bacterium]